MSDEQDVPPEEPRGDEPYWFEELRRDSAYAAWSDAATRSDEYATERQDPDCEGF